MGRASHRITFWMAARENPTKPGDDDDRIGGCYAYDDNGDYGDDDDEVYDNGEDDDGDNDGESTDADKWCSDMGQTPLWWSDDDDCDDFAHKWSDSPLASIATRKVTNDKNLAILLQSSIPATIFKKVDHWFRLQCRLKFSGIQWF